MKKVVIAGGTGFLGQCLTRYFEDKGYQIVLLSRKHKLDKRNIHYVKWDAKSKGYWTAKLEGAELLINLVGKSVDCRYTDTNKQLIYASRIDSTYILGEVVKELKNPPKLWINAASATIYRHALDRDMDEESGEIGNGFSEDVCQKWEQTFDNIDLAHTRKVILRIGIVLGRQGGALQPLMRLARLGFGGKQGSGHQFVSWLHEDDFVKAISYIIQHDDMYGVYNLTSPHPVTNRNFMKGLRRLLVVPWGLPMPTWLLKMGAMIIGTESELILKSRRVIPKRLLESGYEFLYPNIENATHNLMLE